MSDFNVSFDKVKNKDDAYQAVKSHITPDLIAKFKVKADVHCDDSKQVVSAAGKGFDLLLNFSDVKVLGKLKLSLVLRPLRGKITQEIEKQLKRVI